MVFRSFGIPVSERYFRGTQKRFDPVRARERGRFVQSVK